MKPSEAEEYMGLESGAYDKRQLEQRFRKLSIKLHPDKNVGAEDSTEQFQRLGTAFDTLQRHLRGDGTVRDSDDDASWSDDEDEGSEDVSRGGGGDGGGVPEDIMEMLYRMGVFRDDGDGASRQAFLRFRERAGHDRRVSRRDRPHVCTRPFWGAGSPRLPRRLGAREGSFRRREAGRRQRLHHSSRPAPEQQVHLLLGHEVLDVGLAHVHLVQLVNLARSPTPGVRGAGGGGRVVGGRGGVLRLEQFYDWVKMLFGDC